jgi:hypothetical protein
MTFNSKLETRNSKPGTRNSKLETRNSKLETRNFFTLLALDKVSWFPRWVPHLTRSRVFA